MNTVTRVAAAGLAVGLVIAMLGPFQGLERAIGLTDKQAHALAFAAITSALFLVAPNWSRLWIGCLALGAGIVIELIQGASGRSANIWDLAADAVGILVVIVMWPRRRVY